MVERVGTMIVELVPAPGSGNFVLSSTPSVSGRQPWSFGVAAGWFVTPASVMYFANDTTKQEWGLGTYSAGSLTRDTVLWTSAGSTAKLNFTQPVYVYPDTPAERSVYRDPASGRLRAPYDIASPTQNQGQLAGHRNRIINSGFQINQNGYTSGVNNLASHQYTLFDRWRTGPNGGGFTFTAQKPVTIVTIIGTVEQVIDGANIEGGTYTLSWSGSGSARITYTGGSGTVTSAYLASPFTINGVIAGTDVKIELNNFSIVSKPQFEPGDVATQWEVRLNEQKLCERYRIVGNFEYAGYSNIANTPLWFTMYLPTTMRALPSVTATSTGSTNVNGIYTASPLSNRDVQVQTAINGIGNWHFAGQYTAIAELLS
jgi:hypothetical protein